MYLSPTLNVIFCCRRSDQSSRSFGILTKMKFFAVGGQKTPPVFSIYYRKIFLRKIFLRYLKISRFFSIYYEKSFRFRKPKKFSPDTRKNRLFFSIYYEEVLGFANRSKKSVVSICPNFRKKLSSRGCRPPQTEKMAALFKLETVCCYPKRFSN